MLFDFKFALRMIAGHRWFSAVIILTLALGIGINTTIFTLVNAVMFKPVPVPQGERLVTISNHLINDPKQFSGVSWPDYLDYKSKNNSLEGVEAAAFGEEILSESTNPPERLSLARVTPGLFQLIQIPPVLGRAFSVADGKPGAAPVVLLGHDVWQHRYAGATDVIGRAVTVSGQPATIIGVMPDDFKFPNNEEFWMPLVPDAELEKRSNKNLTLFAILKRGVSLAAANAEFAVLGHRIAPGHPETNREVGTIVRTFQDTYNGDKIKITFITMLGAVGFVLLIACANVANMMLCRALSRGREMAVRVSLGATRWQIVRQLLFESVVLSVAGGALGLSFSVFGVDAFDLATREIHRPYWIQFSMDWRAFAYFAALSVLSGIVFGVVPALRASRVDLNTALKNGTAGGGSHPGRLSGALVVFQFALTMVLLAGAGMMIRSFFAAEAINDFVRPDNLLTARIQLPEGKGERYENPETRYQFFAQLLPELRQLPGVTEASAANYFPGLGSARRGFELETRPNADQKQPPQVSFIVQTPGFLPSSRVPLLAGRAFEETDGDPGKEFVVVSRSFAAQSWPGQPAVGQRLRLVDAGKPQGWMTVIGVAADLEQNPADKFAPPLIHIPYRNQSWGWMGLMVRSNTDPKQLAAQLRAVVQKLDPALPVYELSTLSGAIHRSHWFLSVFGTVFSIFALTGLLMASMGIYAVVAQTTAQRTREIGIRLALGATATKIARLVLSRGLAQLGLGLALGLGGAFAATRLLDKIGFLQGISPNDPIVFGGVTILLLSLGFLACWLPARRATKVDPMVALRSD